MAADHERSCRQLRNLGYRRYLPWLRPIDGRDDRRDRNLDRAVPANLQRTAAADQPATRPADQPEPGARARFRSARSGADALPTAALDDRVRALGLDLCRTARSRNRSRQRSCLPRRDGQFDRVRFEQIIRQAGYTEQRFVDEQRRRILRRSVAAERHRRYGRSESRCRGRQPVSRTNSARSNIVTARPRTRPAKFRRRRRRQLAKFFEERKNAVPCSRISQGHIAIADTAEQLAPWIEMSDADAKKSYDGNRSRVTLPRSAVRSSRSYSRTPKMPPRLRTGLPRARLSLSIAKERGLKDTDIDLGTLAKISRHRHGNRRRRIRFEAGRRQRPGARDDSARRSSSVAKVEPEKVTLVRGGRRRYSSAKSRLERAKSQNPGLYDKIEDERAAGQTLAEVAEKLKLHARNDRRDRPLGPFDPWTSGRQCPEGRAASAARHFATDVGVESDPLQIRGRLRLVRSRGHYAVARSPA